MTSFSLPIIVVNLLLFCHKLLNSFVTEAVIIYKPDHWFAGFYMITASVMRELNMIRVTIWRTKCLGIVTSKVLLTSCSRCNSDGKSPKFLIPKAKLPRLIRVSLTNYLEDFKKITHFQNILHIHLNHAQNVSPLLLLNGLMMVANEESTTCKCFR